MSKKNQPTQPENNVGEAVSSFELFLQKNQKVLLNALLAIAVIVFAIIAINKWYVAPKKAEAKAQMFAAEKLFRANSYEVALNGDGNILGFNQIIDEYGSKAGKSVYLYAGICALQLGNNEDAISFLKKFKGDDILTARAYCCIGDAYANMGDNAKALSQYKKAAGVAENLYAAQYLMKAGIIAEEMGDNAQAVKLYEEIQTKYPQSYEGYEVGKYIARINNK